MHHAQVINLVECCFYFLIFPAAHTTQSTKLTVFSQQPLKAASLPSAADPHSFPSTFPPSSFSLSFLQPRLSLSLNSPIFSFVFLSLAFTLSLSLSYVSPLFCILAVFSCSLESFYPPPFSRACRSSVPKLVVGHWDFILLRFSFLFRSVSFESLSRFPLYGWAFVAFGLFVG